MGEIVDKCKGIWGWIFGHKFEARYSSRDTPICSNEVTEMFKAATFSSIKERIVESAIKREQIYEVDICVRCGQTITKKERNLSTGRALEL